MSLVYFLIGAGILGLLTAYSQMDDGSKKSIEMSPQIAQSSELCLSLLQHGNRMDIPPELANHPQLIACEKIKRMNQEQLVAIFQKFANDEKTGAKLERVLAELRKEIASEATKDIPTAKAAVPVVSATEAVPTVPETENAPPLKPDDATALDTEEEARRAEEQKKKAPEPSQTRESKSEDTVSQQEEWFSVDHSWASGSDVDSSMTGYSDMSI